MPPEDRPATDRPAADQPSFAGAVLTGGASRRMGTDKATVVVDGVAMARRVADALASAGAVDVVAVGGDASALTALGLRTVPDRWPGEGPLGGIVTALDDIATGALDGAILVVAACDLPALTPAVVVDLVAELAAAPVDLGAAVPVVDGVAQPHLLALRASTAPALGAAFAAGERAPRRALRAVGVVEVDLGDATALRDVDRPEDLPAG